MPYPGEKLLEKMWDTVADKGIGKLLRPWQLRREGRALIELRREEQLSLAQTELDAAAIRRGEKAFVIGAGSTPRLIAGPKGKTPVAEESLQLDQEAIEAIVLEVNAAETLRKEANIARALLFAEEELENDRTEPPKQKVDDDWIYRWRDNASQVSSDELRCLWGRVLAGEVKAPGSFSLRTLEFLRNVSQSDARVIELLSRFATSNFVYRPEGDYLEAHGLNLGNLLELQQLGVISGVEAVGGLSLKLKSMEANRFITMIALHGRAVVATSEDANLTVELPCYAITTLGREVLRLGGTDQNDELLREIGKFFLSKGCSVSIGDCVEGGGRWTVFNSVKIE